MKGFNVGIIGPGGYRGGKRKLPHIAACAGIAGARRLSRWRASPTKREGIITFVRSRGSPN
eukprot:11343139-Karenia_brevis.AAC.1